MAHRLATPKELATSLQRVLHALPGPDGRPLFADVLVYAGTNYSKDVLRMLQQLSGLPGAVVVPGKTSYEKESRRAKAETEVAVLLAAPYSGGEPGAVLTVLDLGNRVVQRLQPTAAAPATRIVIDDVTWEPEALLPLDAPELDQDLAIVGLLAIDWQRERP